MPKARETCTECSLRRQKCDKGTPCGRCVKRGKADSCTRSWPAQRARRNSNRTSLDREHRPTSDPPIRTVSVSTQNFRETLGLPSIDTGHEISTLDFMTWKPNELVPNTASGSVDILDSTVREPVSLSESNVSTMSLLQMLLPNIRSMWRLVNFHEKKLLWYHGCYHGPTFNSQLSDRIERQNGSQADVLKIHARDMQWTALLFSILASSMTCASERLLADWGFSKAETQQLCTQWYSATITSLRLADYTSDHNILGAQAIATLTMCAHTLGFSADLHVHLGTAVRIVQALNLHRVKSDDHDVTADSPASIREAVLKKEIARRLWSQLCIQDWFSIPLAEAHSIHRGHFSTSKPGNRDHITMISLSDSIPTYVSYGNYLYEIAALIAEHHAKMANMNTDFTRYQLVREYDSRMRQLATVGRPHYFDVTVAVEESWPWFVPWARRSLTICFAHKIMMIHRSFLKRSFTDNAFAFTRKTCVAASKTILNEARLERGRDDPIIWIDNAFCIAAAITLALDACHRQPIEPEYDLHRQLVEQCIFMLQNQNSSILGSRGVRLLQILLRRSAKHLDRSVSVDRQDDDDAADDAEDTIDVNAIFNAINAAETRDRAHVDTQRTASDTPTGVTSGADLAQNNFDYFMELFPPQTGFSNAFLFEEMLDMNFDR